MWSHLGKVPQIELRRKLGTVGVLEVLRRGRLRWFDHVERKMKDDCVSACRKIKFTRGLHHVEAYWGVREWGYKRFEVGASIGTEP